jgi:putative endonuclease
MASRSRVLYVGVTNNLARRIAEHRAGLVDGFTKRSKTTKLVHFEKTSNVWTAIAREKEIKGWRREKKVALIERDNPGWNDLSAGLVEDA